MRRMLRSMAGSRFARTDGFGFPWIVVVGFAWMAVGLCASETHAAESSGVFADGASCATPYYVQDSGAPGPTVFVVGGVHGNEPAGAKAAAIIRHWLIVRGRLIVLPSANILGLKAETRHIPDAEDALSDLNRDFPKVGCENQAIGVLAKDIWRFVEEQKPDWLIDLHESENFRLLNPGSTGNAILMVNTPETCKASAVLLEAVNATISEEGKKYGVPRPPKDGSLARAAAEHLHINALLFETTRKDQPMELRVHQHLILVHRLLVHLQMMDPAFQLPENH
jgi:hypothetical protein